MAVNHDRRFSGKPERLRRPERLTLLEPERVVSLCLADAAVESVLDVGTGSGLFAEVFAQWGLEVAGVDVNAEMVAAARAYVPKGTFEVASAEALPFSGGAFDLVFMAHVLHEVDDLSKALNEAYRVAKRRVGVLEWPYREEASGPPLAHRLSASDIREAAEEAGFSQVNHVNLQNMALFLLEKTA